MSEEHEILRREVSVTLAEGGDGRTLVSRLVPYGETATVSDDGRTTYKERFLPGAFDRQLNASHRIKAFLNYRHGQGFDAQIGHAERIYDADDGLHGELRVLRHPDGDKALEFYNAGILDKLSIEFEPLDSRKVDGVVERVKARLLGVALCPEGAYSGAAVLALREQHGIVSEPPPAFDPALAASLARFVAVPPELQGTVDA